MNENNHAPKIKVGSLLEYCLDPRYPSLKKELNSSKIEEKLNINVGVALSEPDKHGYVRIQAAYSPFPRHDGGEEVEVHIEFCKVVSG